MNNERLNQILVQYESEYLDFKSTLYLNTDKLAFIKDVLAFSNSLIDSPKYIICGVKETQVGNEIVGINKEEILDQSTYSSWIHTHIEPQIKHRFFLEEYNGKCIFIIEIISNFIDGPFLVKKKLSRESEGKRNESLNEGTILIRKASINTNVTRRDLDLIYMDKGRFVVKPIENWIVLSIWHNESILDFGNSFIEVSITNTYNQEFSFEKVIMKIIDVKEGIAIESKLLGTQEPNSKHTLKADFHNDFYLRVSAKSQTHLRFIFDLTYDDLYLLGCDYYGGCSDNLKATFTFVTADERTFEFNFEDFRISLKGEKVRQEMRRVIEYIEGKLKKK